MLLTPGTRLGTYTIETLIGSGSMGEAYKAHDERPESYGRDQADDR
jgi:serine/threonine protein kinase